jgi:hypothetical protein
VSEKTGTALEYPPVESLRPFWNSLSRGDSALPRRSAIRAHGLETRQQRRGSAGVETLERGRGVTDGGVVERGNLYEELNLVLLRDRGSWKTPTRPR